MNLWKSVKSLAVNHRLCKVEWLALVALLVWASELPC